MNKRIYIYVYIYVYIDINTRNRCQSINTRAAQQTKAWRDTLLNGCQASGAKRGTRQATQRYTSIYTLLYK